MRLQDLAYPQGLVLRLYQQAPALLPTLAVLVVLRGLEVLVVLRGLAVLAVLQGLVHLEAPPAPVDLLGRLGLDRLGRRHLEGLDSL